MSTNVLINTNALSNMNYQFHAEPNVYYHPSFISDAVGSQNTNHVTEQNSSNEESSGVQQISTSNIIDEEAIVIKHLKKVKLSLIIAVTIITVFLVALTIITFALFASVQDGQTQQLPLPVIGEKVTQQVAPLQGNLSLLKNQIDAHTQQLNEYAQQIQSLNEYAQQTQTQRDLIETINDTLAEYAQRTARVEESINHNRVVIEILNKNYANLTSKYPCMY